MFGAGFDDKLNAFLQNGDKINQYMAATSTLNLWPFIINLFIGFILSLILRWHFQRFGSTLSNRKEFGSIFPMVLLTIIVIISVVKSSLALALGLVGALSIVRFRTPIKEPEELAYLFLVIGVGLALGAGQTLAAIVGAFIIMICVSYAKSSKKEKRETGHYLALNWQNENATEETKHQHCLEQFEKYILQYTNAYNLCRFDENKNEIEALYFIDISDVKLLSKLCEALKTTFRGINIRFLDQKNTTGF